MKDLAFFYITCSAYFKLWEPFLILRNKYYGTEIKCYVCTDYLDSNMEEYVKNLKEKYNNLEFLIFNQVSNINSSNGNYFTRINFYCDNIKENYIIYNYDDFWPQYKLDIVLLEKYLNVIKSYKEIYAIKLMNTGWTNEIVNYDNIEFLKFNNKKNKWIWTTQPTLVSINILKEITNYCTKNKNLHNTAPSLLEVGGTNYFRNSESKFVLMV